MYIERDVHMKLKKFIAPLLVGVLAFAIAGCGTNTNQSSQTPKEIKIGATAVSYTHLDVYKRQNPCLPFSQGFFIISL